MATTPTTLLLDPIMVTEVVVEEVIITEGSMVVEVPVVEEVEIIGIMNAKRKEQQKN